jgi:hypothetical protein
MQMPQISRGRALVYVAALLVVLVVAGRLAFRGAEEQSARPAVVAMQATPAPAKKVLVHVVASTTGAASTTPSGWRAGRSRRLRSS